MISGEASDSVMYGDSCVMSWEVCVFSGKMGVV